MKSLEAVFEGIEAFMKEMEELGVDVKVSIAGDPMKLELRPGVTLLAVLQMELGEDLEVIPRGRFVESIPEEGSAHRR